jgi:hypothetical protein
MSGHVECPYCLSDIDVRAAVCPHCARDVGELLRVKARLRELESGAPSAPSRLNRQESPFTATLFVYTVFYACVYGWGLNSEVSDELIRNLLLSASVASGVILALTAKSCDIAGLFLLGFAQPLTTIVALVLFGFVAYAHARAVVPMLSREGFEAGAGMVAGGVVTALVVRQLGRVLPIYVRPNNPYGWLASKESALDRVQKRLLNVGTLAMTIISILTALGKL